MTDHHARAKEGWFADVDAGDVAAAADAIADGAAEAPRNWPRLATESGYSESEGAYYDRLREAALAAARAEVERRERADDRQLAHAVRAMDDIAR